MQKKTVQTKTAHKWLNDSLCAIVVTLAIVALYAHTLHVPWYLDNISAIVKNPLIRDLENSFLRIFSYRGVAIFSFAVNFHTGGLSLPGYHAVNIAIHLLASWLVLLLLKRAVPGRLHLALLGSLIFAVHPLQTQAVTYIVQRMASLSALFFLLSLYLFVRARESLAVGLKFGAPQHLAFYLGSLAVGVLAVFTKENTAILPVALLLFARFFFSGNERWRPLLKYVAPHLLACSLALAWLFSIKLLPSLVAGESLTGSVGTQLLVSSKHNSPLYYFVTEFSVLWVYIRMLFLPFGQALDHNYPIVTTLVSLKSAVAFAGLAGLGCLAFFLRKRRPLLSFGIAWFFLTLAIESSFLPLDPLFEHRLYLPMFGFVLVLVDISFLLPKSKTKTFGLFIAVAVLATLTWQRNNLWNEQIAFYEDNLKKAPSSERVMNNLGECYIQKGLFQEAEIVLSKALLINPESEKIYVNLSKVFLSKGRIFEAYEIVTKGLEYYPKSELLNAGLGLIYYNQGNYDKALVFTKKSVEFNPDFALGYTSIGRILFRQNRLPEAEAYFHHSLKLIPDDVMTRNDLALALYRQNKLIESLVEYRTSHQIDPDNVEAMLKTGLISLEVGDRGTAEAMLGKLKALGFSQASQLETALANALR